jgi:Protein of unknown function (DUF2786)
VTKDQVTDKVRKLLALAAEDSGGTEAERDLALQRAQAMLFKHNLDLADVTIEADRSEVNSDSVTTDEIWRGHLLYTMGKYLFVKVYFQTTGRKNRRRYVMVGRPEAISVLTEMWRYVVTQIEGELAIALSKRSYHAQMALRGVMHIAELNESSHEDALAAIQDTIALMGTDSAVYVATLCDVPLSTAKQVQPYLKQGKIAPELIGNLGVWKRNFLDAITIQIGERLAEQQRNMATNAGSTGTDLVRNEWRDIDAWMEGHGISLVKSKASRKYDANARGVGKAAGGRIDLGGRKVTKGGRHLLPSGD